ncbi:monocarboxylate transporter 13-like [Maniola hyperantus]|uniref:monocarboxylate transporter 13-like n=1 Tax=Aphantopus hyperantus TaxID=2795564 RepID=UPI001568A6C1|nr:monocarboxylate transporter 13-like [Maniola hyperantus]
MSVKQMKSRKYELVAPDGGWGYMVGLGVIINLATLTAFLNCFGMLFKDLFIEINMDSTGVTLFTGFSAFSVAMSGFIARPLLKFMSLRQLGLAAAFMFNLGAFCTVFVKSKLLFMIFQGIVQGLGTGLLYNFSCTMLNNYFVKRRLLAFSFTQTIAAVFNLLSPQFVKWSIEKYGSQGTLLLVSAISMHNIFGMTLMQPVAWHMTKVEVHKDKEMEMKLLLADPKELDANNSLTHSHKSGRSEYADKKHDSKIKMFFSRFIDFSLFKPFVLSNACIGVAFSGFLDVAFIMLLPQALYAIGWNESEVAKALSLSALGDLVTRIVVILMSNVLKKIGSHETFVAGIVVAFVARIGMLWSDNQASVLTFLTIIGVSRCTITLFTPVVVSDSVGQEKFTSAMGLELCLFGLFHCTAGPAIGAIRDLTGSYSTAFYVLTSGFGIVILSWSIELLYKKKMRDKILNTDASFKS